MRTVSFNLRVPAVQYDSTTYVHAVYLVIYYLYGMLYLMLALIRIVVTKGHKPEAFMLNTAKTGLRSAFLPYQGRNGGDLIHTATV